MLCENCQEEEANCFITNTVLGGDSTTSQSLCVECAATLSPGLKKIDEAMRAGCDYCGREACGGGIDFGAAMATGSQKVDVMCGACAVECSRFMKELLRNILELPQEDRAR